MKKSKTGLVLFEQPCVPTLGKDGALQTASVHAIIGMSHGMEFVTALGMGEKFTTGVRFSSVPHVTIGEAAAELVKKWADAKFDGITCAESLALIERGLLANLQKLEGAYNSMLAALNQRELTAIYDPMHYIYELFLTENGDVYATVHYYNAQNEAVEAVAYLGVLDNCLRHTIGWRPLLLGFGWGKADAQPEITVYLQPEDVSEHRQHEAARTVNLLPPPDFLSKEFTVRELRPSENAAVAHDMKA